MLLFCEWQIKNCRKSLPRSWEEEWKIDFKSKGKISLIVKLTNLDVELKLKRVCCVVYKAFGENVIRHLNYSTQQKKNMIIYETSLIGTQFYG